MSKEATRIYSTWFSVDPLGYWDRNFRGRDGTACRCGADSNECCDEATVWLSIDDVLFDLELGLEVRSASAAIGACGDREGRSWCDICEAERDDGKEESEARGLAGAGGPLVNDWLVAVRVRKGSDPWIEVMFEPVDVLENVEAGLQVDGGGRKDAERAVRRCTDNGWPLVGAIGWADGARTSRLELDDGTAQVGSSPGLFV